MKKRAPGCLGHFSGMNFPTQLCGDYFIYKPINKDRISKTTSTPPKIKIEAENDGLEDDFPFPGVYSQVPAVNLPGCMYNEKARRGFLKRGWSTVIFFPSSISSSFRRRIRQCTPPFSRDHGRGQRGANGTLGPLN